MLTSFQYEEGSSGEISWSVEPITLGAFNLIAGRNAAGKTRVLHAMARAAGVILGESGATNRDAAWRLSLANGQNGQPVSCDFGVEQGAVRAAAPFPAAVREWAEQLQYLPFSRRMNLKFPSRMFLEEAYAAGLSLYGERFARAVLEGLAQTGQAIARIESRSSSASGSGTSGETRGAGTAGISDAPPLEIWETGRPVATPLRRLSQGQTRGLTLVVFVSLLELAGRACSVLVDDFGEGLDFEHARKLGEWLWERRGQSPVQWILATNDRYIMNLVPLEHWTILVQEGPVIRVCNQANSGRRFDDFRFTGLSNFDFFSMDFARGEGE